MNTARSSQILLCIMLLCLLSAWPADVSARYRPGLGWRTVRVDGFTIYYPRGHEAFARQVLARTDNVRDGVTGLFGIAPPHCPVVLHPDTDLFNGFYDLFPNRISLYETPSFSLRGFGPVSDMLDQVFVHEYTHFTHLTARAGWYGGLTRVIGDGLALSNVCAPGWLVEGVTTYAETALTDGGRGRSTLFSGQFGSFSETPGFWDLGALSSPSPYHPPADRIYSAGYFLTDYLARTYGGDAPGRLIRYQARHPLGGTRRAIRQVTGLNPEQFYSDFLVDANARFAAMRAAAAAAELPAPRVLLAGPFDRYHQHVWADETTILSLRSGYNHPTALVSVDIRTGAIIDEQVTGRLDLIGPIRRASDGRLIHARYFLHPLGGGDIAVTDLASYDPATGARERLTRNEHVFGAALSPDGARFAVTRRNGTGIDLVLVDAADGEVSLLVSQPDVFWEAPVWSPDGTVIALMRKAGRNTDIVLVDPDTGAVSLLFASDVAEDNDPAFSPDGRWVVFSSNRTGTWDIFAWDRREKQLFRLTAEPWVAGLPQVSPDGAMLAFTSLESGMERLCVLPFQPGRGIAVPVEAVVGDFVPVPAHRALPELPPDRGIPLVEAYRPFIHAPWIGIGGDEDEAQAGILFMGADPLKINSYKASLLYGFSSEQPGYDVSLINRSLWPDLSLRLYDRAEEGRTIGAGDDIWYRERGAEFAVSLPIILRTAPSVITTHTRTGVRARAFEGIDGLRFNPSHDRSLAVFGEFSIARRPDRAPRDMLPGWGQAASISHEEALGSHGGELPGKNTIMQVSQYVPSPFTHHGFAASAVLQRQDGLLSYDRELSVPRGYDSQKYGTWYRNTLRLTLEYQFPIRYMDTGIGLTAAAHLYLLKGAVFADTGAGWHDRFDVAEWRDRARTSVGGMLAVQGSFLTWMPLEVGVLGGYRLAEQTSFAELVLQVQL